MAGHSHSANIKYRKAAVDARRGKVFSKLARMIISAARQGGGDPEANLKLRYAIEKARAVSMPKDNIERAIRRGTGEGEGENYEEVLYEGFAPGGVAVLAEALTDNRHRTAPEVRKAFELAGGSLGTSGSVAWMFARKALFRVPKTDALDEDALLEAVVEAGAEDLTDLGDTWEVRGDAATFAAQKAALEASGLAPAQAELGWVPRTTVEVADSETARKVVRLMEALEEHDDVQNVSSNYDIPEELLLEVLQEGGGR